MKILGRLFSPLNIFSNFATFLKTFFGSAQRLH